MVQISKLAPVSETLWYALDGSGHLHYFDGETLIAKEETTAISQLSYSLSGDTLFGILAADSSLVKWTGTAWTASLGGATLASIQAKASNLVYGIRSDGSRWTWNGTTWAQKLPALASGNGAGLCPAPGTPSGKFLKDDMTWAEIPSPPTTGWTEVDDTWTYSSATEITVPSGAASLYSPGMRIKLTQTTVQYFIITAVADTKLTVFGGTDYTLASAAITDPCLSTHKAPLGFPLSPDKWTVETTSTSDSSKSNPANGAWYNKGGSLAIPIGAWKVSYSALLAATENTDFYVAPVFATLSTANNTESEKKYTRGGNLFWVASGYGALYFSVDLPAAYLNLAAAATYYLNIAVKIAGVDSISVNGATQTTMIRAVCAYL